MMVITGERIQECADIYIGTKDDFEYNPKKEKQVLIDDLLHSKSYNNPKTVFVIVVSLRSSVMLCANSVIHLCLSRITETRT
jgi:hypothetical protein